jgi:hypothetical protein
LFTDPKTESSLPSPYTNPASELVALQVAVSFAAGLNVYATLITLGLLAHARVLPLPPGLQAVELVCDCGQRRDVRD